MNLLSDNDWKALSAALYRNERLTLVRTLGETKITAQTEEAGKAWPVSMVVGVVLVSPSKTQRQYFETAEEAKSCVNQWRP